MNVSNKNEISTTKTLIANINDSYIDIEKEFDFSENLTAKQKLFVFYYIFPINNPCYKNASASARKAGYKSTTSASCAETARCILKKDIIQKEISRLSQKITENLIKTGINESFPAIIASKTKRLYINPTDYYNFEQRETEEGNSYIVANAKPPEQLSPEQLEQILDVEFVGQKGIVHYRLPNKEDTENELVRLIKDFTPQNKDNEFEVETTAQIIGQNLQLKTKVIKTNEELYKIAKENNAVQSATKTTSLEY